MTTTSFLKRATPALGALIISLGCPAPAARADDAVPAAPRGPELTARGEAAERAGHLADAAALFAQARALDSMDLGPMRGACRVALALGDQTLAREACHRAFMAGGTVEDSRHDVAALMVGATPPKMNELVTSLILADGAVRIAPGQPWGYAARCDVALRLEDRDMLDACVADLVRVAPGHIETKRAAARAGASGGSLWVWLGRLGLLLVLAGTAAHALRGMWLRRARRRRSPSAPTTGAIVLGAVLIAALPASAAEPPAQHVGALSGVTIDDANPEAAVPDLKKQLENPLAFGYVLQDMLDGAANATKAGDYRTAMRYYRALTKAVPRRAYPFRKLCEAAEKVGERGEAITACRQALSGEDVTPDDYTRYVRLTLGTPGELSPDTLKDLDEVVQHLSAQPGSALLAAQARCEIALRLHDVPGLESCTATLATAAPDALSTVSFQWALQVERHDRASAQRLVDRARQLGLDQAALGKMEAANQRLAPRWRLQAMLPWMLGAILAVSLAGGALLVASRRLRKSSAA